MDLPIKYCIRCVMPETQEGQSFDQYGFCNVCRSSEDKMSIDWVERRTQLGQVLQEAKNRHKDDPYDCLIPISGGKDSTFQLHVLVKEFGMRPLAVTFSHNWFTPIGMYNLVNCLEVFDVDHVMFTPKRSLVNRSAKRSVVAIGDACWHCHAGVGAFPLKIALDYGINLIVWGESVAESSSRGTYSAPIMKFDQDYFRKVSAKLSPSEFASEGLSLRELRAFETPNAKEYETANIIGIHLGDYLFWDEERQTEFITKEYGWKSDDVEGTYKGYKSAECIMPGVHDFACYLKRGYGRTSFHVSSDIRAGILSKDEISANFLISERSVPPTFKYFSEITGMSLDEFVTKVQLHQHESLVGKPLPLYDSTEVKKPKELFVEKLRRWVEEESND